MPNHTFAKLTRDQQDFITGLALRNHGRAPETTLALARVLSKLVPIPSSPVESVEKYYREQGLGAIDQVLECLNSLTPFDFSTVKDLSLHFFRYAYDVCHGDCKSYNVGYENGLATFFRLNKHFSPETLCLINDKHKEISQLVAQLSTIVETVNCGGNNVSQ